MLRVSGLRAWYGATQALFDVNVVLAPGAVLALVGTNGAGKSTTVRSVLGLIKTQGVIEIDGIRVDQWPTHRRIRDRGVAVVHESRSLFGNLTVGENVRLGLTAQDLRHLDEVTHLFPVVRERSSQLVSTLSGGQRQMVAVARAMLARPQLLILDEPSLGLAPKVVDEIYERIRALAGGETSILLIEQSIPRVQDIADQVQLIAMGRTSPPLDASDDVGVLRLQRLAFGNDDPDAPPDPAASEGAR